MRTSSSRRRQRPASLLPRALRGSRARRWYVSLPVRAAGLVVLGVALFAALAYAPGWVPPCAYAPLILLAGLFLTPRWLILVSATYFIELSVDTFQRINTPASWLAFTAIGLVAFIMLSTARSRARLGVQGHSGESMFVDLRDRLRAFGELPELPPRWHVEASVESAYGQSFSGDFVVATRSGCERWFEVVLVDVSGKGLQAGTRSLLLSGALGGLLGETTPERFLGAANSYLVRQNWAEGFATAVHLSIDLVTGEFTFGNAGHPSPAQYFGGSGSWLLLSESSGPLLGVIPDAAYLRGTGQLDRGDALILYTDGVIETRDRDLTAGVDRMLGAAERLVPKGFTGGAKRLSATAIDGESDDRAVVMLWRD